MCVRKAIRSTATASVRTLRPRLRNVVLPTSVNRSISTDAVQATGGSQQDANLAWISLDSPSDGDRTAFKRSRLTQSRAQIEARPFSAFLKDSHNRYHDYLCISLTERCNLRCLYCMPEEGVPLSPPEHILTTPEIVYLSELFVKEGVTKARPTGGEPTVRKDILYLVQQIGQLRKYGLKESCLTTNCLSLARKLDALNAFGVTRINLSLDTLDLF